MAGLFSLLAIILAISLLLVYRDLTRDLPSLEAIPSLLDPSNGALLQPTRLYDRSGEHLLLELANPSATDRHYLRVATQAGKEAETFSQALVAATIATVDPTFWDNPGYSLQGLREGTHLTLAQHLISDLLLWDESPSLRRNLRERMLAAQLVSTYGRDQVLEWYLNSTQYGHLIYGADAASRVYFGKPASQLSIAEAALLAAAAEAPGISPLEAPEVVLERQKGVIAAMLVQGRIDGEQAAQASQEKLIFQPPAESDDLAPAFTNLVLEQLAGYYPIERLERGGFKIITTLDGDLQTQASCTTTIHLARLQGVETDKLAGSASCDAARLLPTLIAEAGRHAGGLSAAVVILDPRIGQILAMVGDATPGVNPVVSPGSSGGSILAPLIYLTGFTHGLSPSSLVWDIPVDAEAGGAQPSQQEPVQQTAGITYHGPVRLRTALVNDYAGAAQQVWQQVGGENVYRIAQQLGLQTLTDLTAEKNLTLTQYLQQPVTLLEMAQVYSAFANQGVLEGKAFNQSQEEQPSLSPTGLLRLEAADGKVLVDWSEPQSQSVLSPQLAYLVNHVLSDEASRWPSQGHPNLLEIGRPVGAKMGVVEDGSHAWTVGYVPQLVVGTWVGYPGDNPGQVTPGMSAALWRALIQYATRSLPAQNWAAPPGILVEKVCDPSGLLPTPDCPTQVTEIFLEGNEPTQADNLYRKMLVNRETGHLATIFTPPDLVEERTYLVVSPQAIVWAQSAGLPIAPDSYDMIFVPPHGSDNARFTSPALFSHVGGMVSLQGSADGEGFTAYRLQVGQGLNPQEWLQIGQDIITPVEDGVLGVWDTAGLDGLYVIQLLVVRQDQRVESDIVQVTVDNQPPQVQILNPSSGSKLTYHNGDTLPLLAEASDNLTLSKVEFMIDGNLVVSFIQAPYTILWRESLGEHTFTVQAYDLAGNSSQATLHFIIQK